MNEEITSDILDRFEDLTKYPVRVFLNDYVDFVDNHYSNLTSFFQGNIEVVPTQSFNKLKLLTSAQKSVVNSIILNNSVLDNYEFWVLTEYVEDIGQALETANNISRWMRSSTASDGYSRQVLIDAMLSQGEELEMFERNQLKSSNSRDSWVETAMQNELREEDYDLQGGQLLKVVFKNSSSLFLNGVVDNIDSSQKTYGIDVDRTLSFENDDLSILSYEQTMFQSIDILSQLKKGDDPAFVERGVNKEFLGGNIAGISYPIIFRDMASVFATDDSFQSFTINDVSREQDAVIIKYQIQTKAGDFFNKDVVL